MTRSRRIFGWLLAVVGALVVAAGVFCAAYVGPDSAVDSGPHRLSSAGSAIVTADGALDRAGPTVHLSVTMPHGGEVFVGVANAVDVDDYVAGCPVTRVDSASLPWNLTTTDVAGRRVPAADPTDLDWWIVSDSGTGAASISFPLPDEVVDVVVMDPDRGADFAADVTVGVEAPGLFIGAIAAAVFGLGVILGGGLILRTAPDRGLDDETGAADAAVSAEPAAADDEGKPEDVTAP